MRRKMYDTCASDNIKRNIDMTAGRAFAWASVDDKSYDLTNVWVEADGYNLMRI